MMKTENGGSTDQSNIFLTGAILFANMDYAGLTDYAIKAILGGTIWMIFKIGGDLISDKLKKRKQQ